MKTTVNDFAFLEAFRNYDRFDQFGAEALRALFDYLEELEDDTGEELELDVIALCCEYSVDTPDDIRTSYGLDEGENVLEWLTDNTMVVGEMSDGRILYCSAF